MRRRSLAGVAVLPAAVLAWASWIIAAPAAPPAGWAVLVEYNSYDGRYPDLPVGYINSGRILIALARRGWPPDHILLVRDNLDRGVLRRATAWLAARVRPGDTAILYVAGEYQFFDHELLWETTFPKLWTQVPTPRRVLIVETCFAQRLTAAAAGIPGLGLPAVGRDELDWWGVRQTGRVIEGGSFTYFFARAIESQPMDAPSDFAAAFATAVAGAREYFRTVIALTPHAIDAFHARGSYPERLDAFPNPRLVEDTGNTASTP